MKSKIRKSVIPFGAIIAAALFVFTLLISIIPTNSSYANDGSTHSAGRMLTVYDRGQQKVIITQRNTVGEALAEARIAIDTQDVVEPATTEKLVASDYQINIYRARPVIVVDGNTRTRVTTAYQTAEQIVKSAGIVFYDEDIATIDQNPNIITEGAGLQVTIKRAKSFNLTLYGKSTVAHSQEKTVGKMLFAKGVALQIDDKVVPDIETPLTEGMTIRVWREGKQVISVDEPIQFDVEQIEDADREMGYSEVKIAGTLGSRSVSYEVLIQDGVEVGRTEIASVIISQPKTQTESVGVKGKYTTPSENENITWNFLIEQGFSRIQTAGIMGNLMQEHRFRTDGDGLAQWIGGRKERLYSMDNPDNIYTQLNFLMSELNGGYAFVRDSIKASSSLGDVVEIFQNHFEVCNPYYCMQDQRTHYAGDILASH